MTSDEREMLSALIDGEAVNADRVAGMLESAESRALLVEFVRLRERMRHDEAGDSPRSLAMPARGFVNRSTPIPLRAAAALALVVGGAGAGAWVESYLSRERPPEPSRVVQMQPIQDLR